MLADHKGFENVLECLKYTLMAQLPAKIAAVNAATSATVQSWLAGSYVLSTSKTFIYTVDGGTERTITVSAGTYTAAQLAAILNANTTFATLLTASTEMGGTHLVIYVTTRGAVGSIKIGEGTINSILGWRSTGFARNYRPCRNVSFCEVTYPEFVPWGYPALSLWCEDVVPQADKEHLLYTIKLRLRETMADPDVDQIYYLLSRTARAIYEILTSATNAGLAFGGKINTVMPPSYQPYDNLFIDPQSSSIGQLDFSVQVLVQED